MSKYLKSLLCSIFVFSLFFNQAKAAPDFLPPEKAFLAETSWSADGSQIVIQFAPVKGYYIYKEALHFQLGREQKKLSVFKPNLPVGIEKFDPTFQKNLQIYKQPFEVFIPLASAANQPIYLEIELQGCAEAGICYPPMTMHFLLTTPGSGLSRISLAASLRMMECTFPQLSIRMSSSVSCLRWPSLE